MELSRMKSKRTHASLSLYVERHPAPAVAREAASCRLTWRERISLLRSQRGRGGAEGS
jgi:hypothetical protein